ncbi:hypothetical protein DYB32_006788 [Aphanomyces invadans]|uniref:Uncharacterized protein n=1 Tax=Aphanomyces invadans TaxID=157072 RepID=A0A418AQN3_9STRA|nr:hypothetical protein DYB32_006788 [Aphanomyces invadans]
MMGWRRGKVYVAAATDDDGAPPPPSSPRNDKRLGGLSNRVSVAVGLVYVVLSMACNVGYLVLLAPHASNDHWWRRFNVSGTQTFVADVFNAQLHVGHATGPVDLLSLTSTKAYDMATTFVDVRRSTARQYLLSPIAFSAAIDTIRRNGVAENLRVPTQYCWADLGRRFEMAHTAGRQRRCAASDKWTNAALVLASVLRNIDVRVLLASEYAAMLDHTVLHGIAGLSTAGQEWVDSIVWARNASVGGFVEATVEAEAAAWRAAGFTRWSLQLQNLVVAGFDESIDVVNALGMRQPFQIYHEATYSHTIAGWTTSLANPGFWNDLGTCESLKCSLVRGTPNSIDAMAIDWDVESNGPLPDGTGSGGSGIGVVLMHAHMGPYSSVDMELVAIPVSLAAYYDAFRRDLFAALGQDDRVATAFSAQVDRAVVDAAPWSRREYWFYGGNPMCPKGTRQPFVQPSFGFSDDCSKQIADGVALERMAVLFALATTAASSSRLQDDPQRGARLCALAATTAPLCEHALALASRTHDLLTPHWTSQTIAMKDTAVVDTMELQISTLQFATARNDTVARVPELLVQLVAGDGGSEPDASSLWPFFGWITLYEWLDGRREVFDFQGDVGRFKLMSAPLPFQSMVANPAQLPHSACKYVHYISIYVSMVLVGVAIVASMAGLASLCSTARSPGHLSHWIFFNRVVGSVWVGRPMLCIRGMTAVMVLATAPIDLVKSHGYTQLMSAPRSVGHVAVVAGEATWLSYVLSDILLPTMHSDVARVVAPLSALAAWTASVLLEVADPWQVRATLGRDTCHIQSFRHGVSCASGEIQVGSVHRVLALVLVQVGSTIVATCVAYVAGKVHHRVRQGDAINDKHVLVPGASAAFLHGSVDAADVVGCILSGILPTTTAFFDVKLWMPIAHSTAFHSTCPFRWPTAAPPPSSSSSAGRAAHRRWRSMASPALGLAYMMASVVSSYSFLDVTKSTMANDLWWVGFDTPGTHAYLANWFNQYLQVTDYVPTRIHLPDPKFAAIAAPNNATQTRIVASPMYSSAPHRGLSTLENVVAGLRRTPGCMLPWVFTPYCYVDFGKRWELAHSAARQLRCANMTDNGAVFLEAVLRNADWDGLMACWGHSLNVAVFADVQLTSDGQQWLTRVRANALTVADEVDVWSRLGIVAFTTQWQNFKRLGIDESFSIQNAFGVSYAMALKKSNGTLQFASQTSFQLYWSFASDLWAVAANSTRMGGRSLVRTSRDYAWYNVSLEDILLDNGTVDAPLTRSRSLVRAALGPFGTIDAKRIPCPESLRVAHQVGTEMLARTLSASAAAQDDFWGIYHTFNYSPMPQAWSEGAYGGSLLCDINSAASKQPCEFFTYKGGCSMFGAESTLGSTVQAVKSLLAVGAHEIARGWVESTCERELSERESCVTQLTDAIAFLAKHVSLDDMQTMSSLGSDAKAVVRDELQVDYVQFVSLPGASAAGMTLARENFFHSRDMEFFSWLLLWEWVDGKREVTLFHGDAGRICAMSTSDDLAMSPTSAMDIPLNVANYLRAMVQYTSLVLCAVAVVVSLYIVANRGRVEGINMLSFNRVCGLVWIGRPLLFIRGITALCVLSTASLELTRPHSGLVTFFQSKKPDWVATVLSSGEMTWLVYVVNDVASAYTQQFTGKSAMSSTIVAGLVALVWSAVVGVEPFVDLRRQCQWVHVDFQLTCTSGSVHIGRFDRFGGLLSVIVAACVVCYGVVRRSNPTLQPTTTSLLLHLSAKYHFRRRPWEFDGIYHLDRASAAMNGLVSVDWVHATFVLDVKVWRTYMVSKKETTPPPIAPSDPSWRHLHTALPLVQEHSIFDTP